MTYRPPSLPASIMACRRLIHIIYPVMTSWSESSISPFSYNPPSISAIDAKPWALREWLPWSSSSSSAYHWPAFLAVWPSKSISHIDARIIVWTLMRSTLPLVLRCDEWIRLWSLRLWILCEMICSCDLVINYSEDGLSCSRYISMSSSEMLTYDDTLMCSQLPYQDAEARVRTSSPCLLDASLGQQLRNEATK